MKKNFNKKNFIIEESAKLFYYNGYKNTGISDILSQCSIPKGSFYHYFKKGKEELLQEVIQFHTENLIKFFNNTVNDLSILKLKNFFSIFFNNIRHNSFYGGSPLGNLAMELSDINPSIREKLLQSYQKIEVRFSYFLYTLKNTYPEKYNKIKPELHARILVSLLEGTLLKLKIEKDETPVLDFLYIFDTIFLT